MIQLNSVASTAQRGMKNCAVVTGLYITDCEALGSPIFVTFLTISNNAFFLALPISLIYCCDQAKVFALTLLVAFKGETNMKLRDPRLAHRAQGSITNQEVIRATAVTAELKLNIEKAHKLVHTARNLITVHRLTLELIHWRKHRRLSDH